MHAYFLYRFSESFPWTAQSSEINVTENIWKVLKSREHRDILNIKSHDDLTACVLKFWRELHSSYIQQLPVYELIPYQIHRLLINRKYITKY